MEKRNSPTLHCWWECKLVQPLWKTVWRFLKNRKIVLPYDPAIPLLGIYPDKTLIQKDTCIPVFTAALFIAKTWKQPKCPSTVEWIKKMWYIHTMKYLLFFLLLSCQPHGLQHIRFPCPPLSPSICSDSCPLSQWCYLIISPSGIICMK